MELIAIAFWVFFILTIVFIVLGSYFIDLGLKNTTSSSSEENLKIGGGCIGAGLVCFIIMCGVSKAIVTEGISY